jgi:F0F1-type ATP synthase membrane subunit c/vacuolar-type H+-ATPase subunit K
MRWTCVAAAVAVAGLKSGFVIGVYAVAAVDIAAVRRILSIGA